MRRAARIRWRSSTMPLDAGINFIDTANSYGRGTSETLVGEALRAPGRRQRVVLATKVHFAMDDDDPNAQGNSRRHILEQCEASLRRLQTEYIDLYQIHRPSPDVPPDETLRALDDLVRSGKVRYIGTSTWPAWQVVESLWVAEQAESQSADLRAAAVSPAGPPDRARAGADGADARDRDHPVGTAGQRVSDRDLPARTQAAPARHAVCQESGNPGAARPAQRGGVCRVG